jgi:hypothetical protein
MTVAEHARVAQRVPVNDEQVGDLAYFDGPEVLVEPEGAGAGGGGGRKRLVGA